MNQIKTGNFIKELRKEKGLTQLELADKIGVSDRTISKWETGKGMPDYSLFESLCTSLGISVDELLAGERKSFISNEQLENVVEEAGGFQRESRGFKTWIAGLCIVVTIIGVIALYYHYRPNTFVYACHLNDETYHFTAVVKDADTYVTSRDQYIDEYAVDWFESDSNMIFEKILRYFDNNGGYCQIENRYRSRN